MDRKIVIPLAAPIPHGHRVEVIETADDPTHRRVTAVIDLDSGVRYAFGGAAASAPAADAPAGTAAGEPAGTAAPTATWIGTTLACTVTAGDGGAVTTLLVDPAGPSGAEADVALRGADAAAEAARAEAVRWGGLDRPPQPEPIRIW